MATSTTFPGDTIVIALDGSPAAASALPLAAALAARLAARLRILRVLPGTPAAGDTNRSLASGGTAGKHTRMRDDPAAAILRAAADPAVALVVMATHGGAVGGRPRLGHVAERVITETTRPILLVRPEAAHHAVNALRSGHLLLPLDGAPATTRSLGQVVDLACRLDTSLDLLFVVSGQEVSGEEPGTIVVPQLVDQPQHAWPEWQRDAIERLGVLSERPRLGVPAHTYATGGRVPEAILRFAHTHHEGLIALVRRSHLEAGHALVLREVLTHASCPVVVTGAAPARGQGFHLRLIRPARHRDAVAIRPETSRRSRPTATAIAGASPETPQSTAPAMAHSLGPD